MVLLKIKMLARTTIAFVLILLLGVCSGHRVDEKSAHVKQVKEQATAADAEEAVAVSVARTTPLTEFAWPVPFPDVVVDQGKAWNQTSNSLSISDQSVYFFNLNAGAVGQQRINMNLEGTANFADVLRWSTAHTGADTTGRSFITRVGAGASVSVSSDAGCALYSDGGRQTSLTAIDLLAHVNGTQDPVVMSVARVRPFTDLGAVAFDNELVNIGSGFDNVSKIMFTAPQTGIYFFVFSAGIDSSTEMRAGVYKFGTTANTSLVEVWRGHGVHNGQDTAGASFLYPLAASESVFVQLGSGELYSDGTRQTFFGGFLYSPNLVEEAAWSCYRNTSAEAMDPLKFNGCHVNTDMFDINQHVVNISVSGVYYVTLTVGAFATFPVDAFVVRDRSRAELSVYRETAYHTGMDSLNHGILMRLSAGNTLRVVVRQGSLVHSTSRINTVFSGFLLAP